eukprot:Rmarinus@m.10563
MKAIRGIFHAPQQVKSGASDTSGKSEDWTERTSTAVLSDLRSFNANRAEHQLGTAASFRLPRYLREFEKWEPELVSRGMHLRTVMQRFISFSQRRAESLSRHGIIHIRYAAVNKHVPGASGKEAHGDAKAAHTPPGRAHPVPSQPQPHPPQENGKSAAGPPATAEAMEEGKSKAAGGGYVDAGESNGATMMMNGDGADEVNKPGWYSMEQIPDDDEGLIHVAAFLGHVDLLEFLLYVKRVSPDDRTRSGLTAAHIAAGRSHVTFLRKLVIAGANLSLETLEGLRPLHFGASQVDYDVIDFLIHQSPSDLNARTVDGESAIMVAAQLGLVTNMKLLLTAGADVAVPSSQHGWTLLHEAVRAGQCEIVRQLADASFNPSSTCAVGQNSAHVAAYAGNVDMLKLLKELGVDMLAETKYGHSPLDVALKLRRPEAAAFLRDIEKRNFLDAIEELTAQLEDVQAVCKSVLDQRDDARKEIVALKLKVAKHIEERDRVAQRALVLKNTLEKSESLYSQTSVDLEKLAAQYEQEKKDIQAQHEFQIENQNRTYGAKVAALQERVEALESEKENLEKETEKLKGRLAAFQSRDATKVVIPKDEYEELTLGYKSMTEELGNLLKQYKENELHHKLEMNHVTDELQTLRSALRSSGISPPKIIRSSSAPRSRPGQSSSPLSGSPSTLLSTPTKQKLLRTQSVGNTSKVVKDASGASGSPGASRSVRRVSSASSLGRRSPNPLPESPLLSTAAGKEVPSYLSHSGRDALRRTASQASSDFRASAAAEGLSDPEHHAGMGKARLRRSTSGSPSQRTVPSPSPTNPPAFSTFSSGLERRQAFARRPTSPTRSPSSAAIAASQSAASNDSMSRMRRAASARALVSPTSRTSPSRRMRTSSPSLRPASESGSSPAKGGRDGWLSNPRGY